MLAEVRVMSYEGSTARASREASARLYPSYPTVAGVVAGPVAKGKGKHNIFTTDEGCHRGR
eukprot:1425907-Prorocentrum_lima.AAC.1